MDVDKLIADAWKAVRNAGVPAELNEIAFKEAVGYLRSGQPNATGRTPTPPPKGGTNDGSGSKGDAHQQNGSTAWSESTFFTELSHESEVPESDLRDVLMVSDDGNVQVATRTTALGSNQAIQARNVIALVAGARSRGLGEKPVSADHVRQEVMRKNCYQQNNYASSHLGAMKGFNVGSSPKEIVLTSKWIDEFKAAIDQALGR